MRRIILAAVVICAFLSPSLFAQKPMPKMVAKSTDDRGFSSVQPVAEVQVNVTIFGSIAETEMLLTFTNNSSQVLEGDLSFPLPEGSIVSGYALDINGAMVDGVVVDKQKATQAFEREVVRRVDPGLVEMTKRSNFRTRVYPIPAQGTRKVMVKYIGSIPGGSNGAVYTLPLGFEGKMSRFRLRVDVLGLDAVPVVDQSPVPGFEFRRCDPLLRSGCVDPGQGASESVGGEKR
jgi:Ca-activated chloride channel family protein